MKKGKKQVQKKELIPLKKYISRTVLIGAVVFTFYSFYKQEI